MACRYDKSQLSLKQKSFFIIDHQFLTRSGTRSILEQMEEYTCVGESEGSITEWKREVLQLMPDLLVIDYIETDNSQEFIDQLEQLSQFMKVLIISSDTNIKRINQSINSGISGFLSKSCNEFEIREAIKKITQGQRYFCNRILDLIMGGGQKDSISMLSEREQEVLGLIVKGHTTKRIADQLHLSVHTINSHRKNMLKKLGFKSPAQLISFAVNQGVQSL